MHTIKVVITPPTVLPVAVFGPACLRMGNPVLEDLDACFSQTCEAT
jgi:hypothetical protein